MKTKLVVVNENTLGYIIPELPDTISILHASILKGSVMVNNTGGYPINNNSIRLATEKDFEDYRVSFEGYKKDSQNYEFN